MQGTPWLVLPTYNEAENIERIVAAASNELAKVAPDGFRVLIVDDGSPDGTGEIADRLAAESESIEVLHRTSKEGIGPAYIAGFRRALRGGADYVLEMDADFSHDPRDLGSLLAAAQSADVVLGSRYVRGGGVTDWGLVRRAVSRGGGIYARVILGVPVNDLTGGFKCFRRAVLEKIDLSAIRSRGYGFQIELTYKALLAGFTVKEVPIVFRDRTLGESKMSLKIAVEAARLVPSLRLRELRGRRKHAG